MVIEKFREISPHLVENESMAKHTTFKVGGAADMFISVKSVNELQELVKLANKTATPFIVIGNGSNILCSDKGIRGLVIEVGNHMNACSVCETTIHAQAGILLSKLAAIASGEELTGLEEVSGIPGTLGGAIYMNAGAYGGEIKTAVKNVTYVDNNGDLHTVSRDECNFGYRQSIFTDGDKYIVSAELELKCGDKDMILSKMADYTQRRREKQPLAYPSAGSTFKRPEGHFAGALIEQAGLKGYKSGGAMVSDLHAGFVINCGGATYEDVMRVIRHVQKTVYDKFGVVLEPEVRILGE